MLTSDENSRCSGLASLNLISGQRTDHSSGKLSANLLQFVAGTGPFSKLDFAVGSAGWLNENFHVQVIGRKTGLMLSDGPDSAIRSSRVLELLQSVSLHRSKNSQLLDKQTVAPNERYLAYVIGYNSRWIPLPASFSMLRVVDHVSGEDHELAHFFYNSRPVWSRDGCRLYIACSGEDYPAGIRVFDIAEKFGNSNHQ